MNILILIAYYHDYDYISDAIEVLQSCTEHNFSVKFAQGADIGQLRNSLVTTDNRIKQDPLKKYDFALTVDSDVMPEKDKILKMISYNKDIVCLPYLQHKSDTDYICGELDEYNIISSHYDNSERDLKKIGWAGGGMMLIKTSIFPRMEHPYYEHHTIKKGDAQNETSEMVGFCINAKKWGIDIWCDFDNPVHHNKRTLETINKQQKEKPMSEKRLIKPNLSDIVLQLQKGLSLMNDEYVNLIKEIQSRDERIKELEVKKEK